ncbi:hypothetical protein GG804_12995 [Sphingomonas histidinilytica]|nr:hypothetical protein [Rhizorhabdus histidinilytica]
MQRGRKAEPPGVKAQRGTLKPCRDSGRTEIMVAGDPPMMPDYLTPEAQDVWQEEIGRVMSAGVTEIDSSLFARYCALEALIRKAFSDPAGEPPPAAYLTTQRQMAELLGIAGRKSRVGKAGNDPTKNANPFARNGSRARA